MKNEIEEEQASTIEDAIEAATKANVKEPERIFGFDGDELNLLKETWKTYHNPEDITSRILTKLFRENGIRAMANIDMKSGDEASDLRRRILDAFITVQSLCLVKEKVTKIKTRTLTHKQGEVMTDEHGEPIPAPGTSGYRVYSKDIYETTVEDQVTETPYYDVANSSAHWTALQKIVDGFIVTPDYAALKAKTCSNCDFEKGIEIIRRLGDYFEIDDMDKFCDRFSLFLCNAKSRVLNIQPKWPVMFSLCGGLGVGKSWFAKLLMKAHDDVFEAQSCESKYDVILNRFNAPMLTRGIVHLDEKNGIDQHQRETLKNYITGENIAIELKNQQPKTVPNLTTLLGTSNESIKDTMGYQKDRRIVEFELKGRKLDEKGNRLELDEQELYDWFHELWMTMPLEHPYADKIKSQLLDESSEVLDTNVYQIIKSLWTIHRHEWLENNFVKIRNMKETLKEMGGVRANDIINWCEEHDLWMKYSNGARYVRDSKWDAIIKEQEARESYIPEEVK